MMRTSALVSFLVLGACSVDVGSPVDVGRVADAAGAGRDATAPDSSLVADVGLADAGDPADADHGAVDAGAAPDAASPRDAAWKADVGALDPKPVTVAYTVDSTTNFANPERGFYHHEETPSSGYVALDAATLQTYRAEGISLVLRLWYVADFAAKDFDQTFLDAVATDLATVRTAGLKAVVRFAYSDAETDSPRDASKDRILKHVAQLEPTFEANADVIAAVQAGFVGVWGEWYYTDHFGDEGVISPAQWADRKEVVQALLGASGGRPVLLRTPLFKQTMYGASALTSAEAFSGSERARLGHHNDCFLANADDFGTYNDVTADKAYLAAETLYVPMGGETCATSSFSGWANAAADLARMHWSFLNADYKAAVLSSWGTNLETAKRSLGYRLALTEGTFASQVAAGGKLDVSLIVRNDGWAAPFNPRPARLVLRETTTQAVHAVALAADPRRWLPGTPSVVAESVDLAQVPPGTYDLFLHLPDASAGLAARAEYAIRLANTGVWEAATGYNHLRHRATVVP